MLLLFEEAGQTRLSGRDDAGLGTFIFWREIVESWRFNPDPSGEALVPDGGSDLRADPRRKIRFESFVPPARRRSSR